MSLIPNDYWKGFSVLIVDDDVPTRIFIGELLKTSGAILYEALTAEKGENILKEHPEINVVLLDLVMPDKGGFEAIKSYHKIDPKLTVIAHTALVTSEVINLCKQAGFTDFLPKPLDIPRFYGTLGNFLKPIPGLDH